MIIVSMAINSVLSSQVWARDFVISISNLQDIDYANNPEITLSYLFE
jgi:hypothetical protein